MKKPKEIPGYIKAGILNEARNIPAVTDIIEHFILLCGGPKAFAEMLFEEWRSAQPGGMVRLRIIDILVKVMDKLGGLTESEELGMVSNEDLEAALSTKLKHVVEIDAGSGTAQTS